MEIVKAKDEESLVRESGLVVTATPSLQPPIKPEWLHQGLHITTVGSDAPEKQELFADVIGQADILVCDLKSQTFVRGEFHHVLESGIISPDDEITELGELVSSQKVVRENPLQISICDLTGVGVQDTMIARFAYQKAVSAGLSVKI